MREHTLSQIELAALFHAGNEARAALANAKNVGGD